MRRSRRFAAALRPSAVVAAACLLLGGLVACTDAPPGEVGGTGPGSSTGTNDGVITMSAPWETTYAQNWNPFSTADTGPGQWFYESLVRVKLSDGTVAPWLAEKWEFSPDGKQVTFHLQPKATWSDGKPVTSDDVVFSLELPLKYPELDTGNATYTKVTKVDEKTFTVTWDEPAYTRLIDLFYPRQIVPKHIYGAVKPQTYLDKQPVGSGPVVVDSFSPQQVTMKLRDDYWGGAFPMKKVRWVVSSESSGQGLISNGTIDVTAGIANVKQFVQTDPKHHQLFLQADGSLNAIVFNAAKPPFNDVNLRRAMASAVAIDEIRKLGEAKSPRTFPPASASGLNPAVYKDVIPDKYLDRPGSGDPEAARAALRAGGYTVANGQLLKSGQPVKLDFLINLVDKGAKNLGTLLVQQLKRNLDLDIKLVTLPEDLYSAATRKGDFTMISGSYGTGRGVYWTYRHFSDELLKPLGQEADGNLGRYADPQFDKLVADYAATGDQTKQKDIAAQLQDRFADQVPAVPLMATGGELVMTSKNWTGWPADDNLDHVPSIGIGADMILVLKDLKPAG